MAGKPEGGVNARWLASRVTNARSHSKGQGSGRTEGVPKGAMLANGLGISHESKTAQTKSAPGQKQHLIILRLRADLLFRFPPTLGYFGLVRSSLHGDEG